VPPQSLYRLGLQRCPTSKRLEASNQADADRGGEQEPKSHDQKQPQQSDPPA
jgi:hypothetical protein